MVYFLSTQIGVWHSLVVRLVRDQEAAGSNPVTPTNSRLPLFCLQNVRQSADNLYFCLFGISGHDFQLPAGSFLSKFQKQICTVCIMERYLAFGEDSLTLRLVSKLPDLRVANAKWIRRTSSSSRSISAPYEIENFIRRDIEVVITGLTRNQFVLTHTRVRIPLSPPKSEKHPHLRVLSFFFVRI